MKTVLKIIGLSLIIWFVVAIAIFVYGPTELFSDTRMSQRQVVSASVEGGGLAGLLVFVLVGGAHLAAYSSTKGKKFFIFSKRD